MGQLVSGKHTNLTVPAHTPPRPDYHFCKVPVLPYGYVPCRASKLFSAPSLPTLEQVVEFGSFAPEALPACPDIPHLGSQRPGQSLDTVQIHPTPHGEILFEPKRNRQKIPLLFPPQKYPGRSCLYETVASNPAPANQTLPTCCTSQYRRIRSCSDSVSQNRQPILLL